MKISASPTRCFSIDDIALNDHHLREFFFLFDLLPEVYFHIKDIEGRFLWMNQTLRNLLGVKTREGYLGKTDVDYFTPDLVFLYHREDNDVISTRQAIINQPWIVPGINSKTTKWYISSKIPLFDSKQEIMGTAGIMRSLSHEYDSRHPAMEIRNVVDYMFEHYTERMEVDFLASLAFLSRRQFERRFQQIFHLSPKDFICKIRIDAAIRLLIESDLSITQIALETGFYDNSYLTRQFKKLIGCSPLQFRKKYGVLT